MTTASNPALPSRLLAIVGPTASGKTELAAELAMAVGGEVIGADSRQVFRFMEAGTAKPSAALRRQVRHHMIDVVDPDDDYDVARWRTGALEALVEIERRGRCAIVCGGTGLYIRSLLRGLFTGPAANGCLRERLFAAESHSPGTLHARLRAVDPTVAARVHSNDVVRLVRALEVFELTGRPLSDWHSAHALAERPFDSLVLEVRIDREELRRRIERRTREIIGAGIVDELRSLRMRGYAPELKAFAAIGYRQAGLCLDGKLSPDALPEAIAAATRSYAKRQLVWIRGQHETVGVPAGTVRTAIEHAHRFFDGVAKRQGIG